MNEWVVLECMGLMNRWIVSGRNTLLRHVFLVLDNVSCISLEYLLKILTLLVIESELNGSSNIMTVLYGDACSDFQC